MWFESEFAQLPESFTLQFSLFCSSVSSGNLVLINLKVKFPAMKNFTQEVKEQAELKITVDVCC